MASSVPPPPVIFLGQIWTEDASLVGNKAAVLSRMAAAGLPVPDGFCIISTAVAQASVGPVREAILQAHRSLAADRVAVRSSTTAEDSQATSYAGQHDSFLHVAGEAELLTAVEHCRQSAASHRAKALASFLPDRTPAAAAVLVQRMIAPRVSGVLFTSDPGDPKARSMLIEATAGTGAPLVGGRVAPLQARLDRASLSAIGEIPPPLGGINLRRLGEFGQQLESLLGGAQDVEWAWDGESIWLLQARPAAGISAAEVEAARFREIARIAVMPGGERAVWVRKNLADELHTPTPMTWSILRKLFTGGGGLGLLLRRMGLDQPPIDLPGPYDLLAGRLLCNLSREVEMQMGDIPLRINRPAEPSTLVRRYSPPLEFDRRRAGWRFWLRLPSLLLRLGRRRRLLRAAVDAFAGIDWRPFLERIQQEASRRPEDMPQDELLAALDRWASWVTLELGSEYLRPAVLAAGVVAELEGLLIRCLGDGADMNNLEILLSSMLPVGDARVDLLADHRGPHELELAAPRWREREDRPRHRAPAPQPIAPAESLPPDLEQLPAGMRRRLRSSMARLPLLLGERERARDVFLLGYGLLRRYLLELDRRLQLGGGVFDLEFEQLTSLPIEQDLARLVREARRRRRLLLAIELPEVLFGDDLEAIGHVPNLPAPEGKILQGMGVSLGIVEARVAVIGPEASPPPPGEKHILVLAALEPSWVIHAHEACGLVAGVGGLLCHGAILARELGVPAVSGLGDAARRLRTGQRVRIDGRLGTVTLIDG